MTAFQLLFELVMILENYCLITRTGKNFEFLLLVTQTQMGCRTTKSIADQESSLTNNYHNTLEAWTMNLNYRPRLFLEYSETILWQQLVCPQRTRCKLEFLCPHWVLLEIIRQYNQLTPLQSTLVFLCLNCSTNVCVGKSLFPTSKGSFLFTMTDNLFYSFSCHKATCHSYLSRHGSEFLVKHFLQRLAHDNYILWQKGSFLWPLTYNEVNIESLF